MNRRCPNCDWPATSGACCNHCGAVIDQRPAPNEENDLMPTASEDVIVSDPEKRGDADVGDFVLYYNAARVFLKGFQSGFNFRLDPVAPNAPRCMDFHIEVDLGLQSPAAKSMTRLPVGGEIHVRFMSNNSGIDIPADVLFKYQKEGQLQYFEGQFLWDCYPPDEASSKVIENLSIRLEGVQSQYAADQNIRILDDFRMKEPQSHANVLRGLKLAPVWKRIALVERPPPPPPPPLRTEAVTLQYGGERLHLLSATEVSLGKNRDCDVVTRIFTPEGNAAEGLNSKISRFHCRIMRNGHHCMLADRGWSDPNKKKENASKWGTYLDRRRVPPMASVAIPFGTDCVISMAGADENDPNTFLFNAHLYADSTQAGSNVGHGDKVSSDSACLILKRQDGIPETYVLLWAHCPLRLIDNKVFMDMVVSFREGSLAYESNGKRGWLVPGETIRVGNTDLKVEAYSQFGL